MLSINLEREGLLDERALQAWKSKLKTEIHQAVARGMKDGGEALTPEVRAAVAQGLKIKRKAFQKSFRAKVYDKKQDTLPVLLVGSKVPWSGIHEHGGRISGKLLVPINIGHPGPVAWANLVKTLFASKQAFFREVNGRVLLFAKASGIQASNATVASRLRVRLKGVKARGETAVPIAVLMPRVEIKARIGLERTVKAKIRLVSDAIQRELHKV